ncbi:phosphotyrosine-specific ptp2-like protein [Emydomyces testavorans]|uniref:protein-tyrosine-phosphatase n=1 Tax=Emydomyces testavorans TaxID=2070801 RepID=A0AAF0IK77_9EURO|nr:phosphotyrosine-specific ptp2-like protein [Emydomyces testavorans]
MSATSVSNQSPGGFSSSAPSGKSEVVTPSPAGQIATSLLSGKNIDPQPRCNASPSYFNITSDTSTLHIHFASQIPKEATPLTLPAIYTKAQRPFPSTSGLDASSRYDGSKVLPFSWQSSHSVSTQHHDKAKMDGSVSPSTSLAAWPWKVQSENNGHGTMITTQGLLQKEGPQLVSPQKPSSGQPQPTVPTVHIVRSGSSHAFDSSNRTVSKSSPVLPPSCSCEPALQQCKSLPASVDHSGIKMISSQDCKDLLVSHEDVTLILDIRPYPQYSQGRIKGSLNLCIPTTLLKRPSFNLQKLSDTLAGDAEKQRFSKWRNSTRIVVYDASTTLIKDASTLINVLKKFTNEGWNGEPLILRGGFSHFLAQFPDWIEKKQDSGRATSTRQPLSINLSLPEAPSISGGCFIPQPTPSVNPMYNSIRQNRELVDGVGQISVKVPLCLTERARQSLPSWLAKASDIRDRGKSISTKFLQIERAEQVRMQEALSDSATYNTTAANKSKTSYRIAGIEMGNKNRYNNIYPYEHCRVKLGSVAQGNCDYVNASYLKATRSNKFYIATQAPLPSTFKDFWHVVWEQDARLIVMLTAESEGPQLKCHPYWQSASYGPLQVELINEYQVPLAIKKPPPSPNKRTHSRRESTGPCPFEDAYMTIRHLRLIHSSLPFEPMREITQLQYSNWPDFGTPTQPAHLLRVIEETNKISSSKNGRRPDAALSEPEPPGARKIIVHCSAGCGRTGTFCTVDSVIDMLQRQMRHQQNEDDWVYRDDIDLIASTVEDFRRQRLSMVQSLRQFVLCYESILEWLASRPEYKDK